MNTCVKIFAYGSHFVWKIYYAAEEDHINSTPERVGKYILTAAEQAYGSHVADLDLKYLCRKKSCRNWNKPCFPLPGGVHLYRVGKVCRCRRGQGEE
jgi:hypothetical protein